jgi:hypothetical protein
MFSDVVLERIAAVRHRFAAHLDDYIDEMSSPLLAADAAGTASLSQAYRRAHKLCGIGPTLGFVATGRRARVTNEPMLFDSLSLAVRPKRR